MMAEGEGVEDAPAWAARKLLRAARAGTLATAADGQPFASLVTPATAPDGSVLMLLSGLSEHTRHLRADGRCAVMVAGAPEGPNPQTAPRLTVTGVAAPEDDPAFKARWVALHPYAAFYADLGDFRLWRLRPAAAQFIGGFARAFRIGREALLPDEAAVAAVGQAEASVLAHCNDHHADALRAIAAHLGAGGAGAWRMVAADVDGCDLADGEAAVLRVPWAAPVADANAIRAELVRLARAARG
jgi:heme iron utilization protein